MTRDKIIALLSEDGKQSAASFAKEIDITIKVVEKQLSLIFNCPTNREGGHSRYRDIDTELELELVRMLE